MTEIYEDIHYKSGWKPLAKEANADTDLKAASAPNEPVNYISEPPAADAIPKQSEIFKELFDISENIRILNSTIESQSKKIDSLENLLEELDKKIVSSKKSTFRLK